MLDVSYGGDGPTLPLPLLEDRIIRSTIGTVSYLLFRTMLP